MPVVAISCGFKSHLLHYFFYSKKETDTVSFFSVLMIQKTSDSGKSSRGVPAKKKVAAIPIII